MKSQRIADDVLVRRLPERDEDQEGDVRTPVSYAS